MCQLAECQLDACKVHVLDVANDRHDQAASGDAGVRVSCHGSNNSSGNVCLPAWGGDGDTDINIVAVDNVGAINDCCQHMMDGEL